MLAEENRIERGTGHVPVPILVVEVLSPSNAERDREVKAGIYLRTGVAEVWLVDPSRRTIAVLTAEGERFYGAAETAESAAVPGFRSSFRDLES